MNHAKIAALAEEGIEAQRNAAEFDALAAQRRAEGRTFAAAAAESSAYSWRIKMENVRAAILAEATGEEDTSYWEENHDEKGNWTGPVRNENGWTP